MNTSFYVSRVAQFYDGHVDKFHGRLRHGAVRVPEADRDHCFHAIATAVLFQRVIQRVNEERASRETVPGAVPHRPQQR